MTPEQAIDIVRKKANLRTRYEGQAPFLDEVLVDEIERLTQQLATAEELLREAVEAWTKACVVASEDGKYSKEYGVAIVDSDWYERAKGVGGE